MKLLPKYMKISPKSSYDNFMTSNPHFDSCDCFATLQQLVSLGHL